MRTFLAIAAALVLIALSATGLGDGRAGYVVIVSTNNPVSAVDREFLTAAFLKKTTTWGNGDVIHPVDLPPGSPTRRQFTEEVLRRSIPEVKGYWQQRIFSGRDVPPPELDSDEDVIQYVLKHDGAVGYVSGAAPLDRVKPVAVR
jgi:ABC-type phosphate transport system substrate-binding protein